MTTRSFPFHEEAVEAFADSLRKAEERLEAIHTYTRPDGASWWHIARLRSTSGRKRMLPFFRGDSTERFCVGMPKLHKQLRPLYNLHLLTNYPDRVVVLVEGERCADICVGENHIATTWPNGSSAVARADFSPLARRQVVLWPDNDPAGHEAMRQARAILIGLDALVVTIDVEALDLPLKGDVVDWVAGRQGDYSIDVESLPILPQLREAA